MPKTTPQPIASLEPLRKALANVKELRAKVAAIDATILAEKKELDRLSKSASADDPDALRRVSDLQGRAALLPGNQLAAEDEVTTAIAELIRAAEAVSAELAALTSAEADQVAREVEALLKPYAPDYTDARNGERHNAALRFGYTMPKVAAIQMNGMPQVQWPGQNRAEHNADQFDAEVIRGAETVLQKAEHRAKHGTALWPNWPNA